MEKIYLMQNLPLRPTPQKLRIGVSVNKRAASCFSVAFEALQIPLQLLAVLHGFAFYFDLGFKVLNPYGLKISSHTEYMKWCAHIVKKI